ncbi:heterokaryon incompatibility protein-domain-containing protein [Xylariaceae sp. FL0255]|nr:heterokaryon incompatibility protein-domain-containing protein [Xylariaceae sp. FL0255]
MSFRLLDIYTGNLTEHLLDACPPYLAASHAWSEQFFPPGVNFLTSPGRAAIVATLKQRYPSITSCWVDTICIDQKDEDDKLRQIPLMGEIFGNAEAVLIILGCDLGMQQGDIDNLTRLLGRAIAMDAEEAWGTEGQYWQAGEGRGLIVQAMKGLARLTVTPWTTRVWTLQEYILARAVIWIGTDLVSLVVDDVLFPALTSICDTLVIDECLGDEFNKLYSFFSGMANSRMRRVDRTRVMELLGNRKATVECDEVYGVMAASGVEITTIKGESKEQAWTRWVEAAFGRGHLRWLLMPAAGELSTTYPQAISKNCVVVPFGVRHKASSGSALDTVSPLDPVEVQNGAVTVTGRLIGSCHVEARLGRVHEPTPNRIHRDITLILFTSGKWRKAMQIASAFGAGRYNARQTILIAQALVNNWARAIYAVRRRREDEFKMKLQTRRQYIIWQDFMAFQMGQMPGMNEGVAHLVTIHRASIAIDAVIVLSPGQPVPGGELAVIDIGGRTVDRRCVFLIATKGSNFGIGEVMHKLCVTLPVTGDYEVLIQSLALQTFTLGGSDCGICQELSQADPTHDNSSSISTPQVQPDLKSRQSLFAIKKRLKKRRDYLKLRFLRKCLFRIQHGRVDKTRS